MFVIVRYKLKCNSAQKLFNIFLDIRNQLKVLSARIVT
jgi:hypothetical protein